MQTKHGHDVHVIEGDAQGIQQRGAEIEDLGRQMRSAATILSAIGSGASEERGRSIEKIKDEVGEAHEELSKAGDRYAPTGTAMKQYGSRLESIQSAMRGIVAEAEQAKATLDQKSAAAASAQHNVDALPDGVPVDDAAESRKRRLELNAADAAGDVTTARRHLDEQLDEFDGQWTRWDEAYDDALRSINDATHGNVTDDWTDNLAGVVEVVVDVLSVVGIVVAIAAIIIGGPILALIGAVIGVIALIGTAYLYAKGRKGGDDLAWAIVGILPFGKLGKLFKAGERMQALAFFKGPVGDIVESVGQIRGLRGVVRGIDGLGTGSGLGSAARAGLASRVGSVFDGLRWRGYGPSGVWQNVIGGTSGAWSRTLATEFAEFSAHHSGIIRGQLGAGGVLNDVIEHGADAIPRVQQAINAADVAVKTWSSGKDAVTVITREFSSDPVDAWRSQLAG
ncbi:TrbC/VirB2 family protein [Agromyces aureus]|uniref:Uncharacterized protein n=1 Tax=Agromyces aureus TaxID=453304 RepID=A0A191WI09_9MICO|nr:TrbC/VirB2 family protein [Agromyces aureus]ANJ27896.1 hypothetical protein ATC03_15405 [Agromyces aureus]